MVLLSHRKKFFIKAEFEKKKVIILEESRNDLFQDILEGKIDVERYVKRIDKFPIYTD